jgi:hypothetical protein
MSVEVHEHLEIFLAQYSVLCSQDGWESTVVAFIVLSIEVLTLDVKTPVAS